MVTDQIVGEDSKDKEHVNVKLALNKQVLLVLEEWLLVL